MRFDWQEYQVRAFLCLIGFCDVFTKVIGPVLVVAAYSIMILMTYTYFDILAPYHQWSSPVYTFITSIGLLLLFGILWNYTCAILTSPGKVSKEGSQQRAGGTSSRAPSSTKAAAADDSGDDSNNDDGYEDDDLKGAKGGHVEDGVSYTYCKSCKIYRPPRSHHCHVCNVCILKMDHHCVWINQCTGHGNYFFFWRTLAFITAGCAYIALVAYAPFMKSLHDSSFPPNSGRHLYVGWRTLLAPNTRLGLSFALGVALSLAVGGLFSWHIYLLSSNQTSIEWHQNRATRRRLKHQGRLWVNPYDLGWRKNMEQVFGTQSIFVALFSPLPLNSSRLGDGMSFLTVDRVAPREAAARRPLRILSSASAGTAATNRRPAAAVSTDPRQSAATDEQRPAAGQRSAGGAFLV